MIREYTTKDIGQIMNIWYDVSALAHPFLDPAFVEKVKKDMREIYIPNAETWVYEEHNTVVGFISMLGNEIAGLFVKPDQHSKGIGTQLVNHVKKLNEELEVEVFEKNIIGRTFYNKYGFTQISRYTHPETGNEILRMIYKII